MCRERSIPYILPVAPEDRIRMLNAQLFRTTNPDVVQIVADELKAAIDAYAKSVQDDFPLVVPTLTPEPA